MWAWITLLVSTGPFAGWKPALHFFSRPLRAQRFLGAHASSVLSVSNSPHAGCVRSQEPSRRILCRQPRIFSIVLHYRGIRALHVFGGHFFTLFTSFGGPRPP